MGPFVFKLAIAAVKNQMKYVSHPRNYKKPPISRSLGDLAISDSQSLTSSKSNNRLELNIHFLRIRKHFFLLSGN